MNFSPVKVPEVDEIERDPAALVRFLRDMQAEIQKTLIRPADYTHLRILNIALAKTFPGQIFVADGTNLDPGEGVGLYLRNAANTAWQFCGPIVYGDWTPGVTFATPGDLAVSYSSQSGQYARFGNQVFATFTIATSAFTHTTAAGRLDITGLPFTCNSTGGHTGALDFGGITKATYTNFVVKTIASSANLQVMAGGSGVAASNVVAADTPTGGTLRLIGSLTLTTT